MDNFATADKTKLGIDYDSLCQMKPDVILVSISASGTTGPEKDYVGFASAFNALSGLGHITGYHDGPPVEIRESTDLRVATTMAFAILAALYRHKRTGQGQFVDLSAREAITSLIGDVLMDYSMNHRIPSRQGNVDRHMAPHNVYRCKGEDKWISIAVATEQEWRGLYTALNMPELATDDRFNDSYLRWQNQEVLDSMVEEWTRSRTAQEVFEILQKAGVAAMPCHNAEELCNDPHLQSRHLFTKVKHPVAGDLFAVGAPWKFSRSEVEVYRHAPVLGEHELYVYHDLLGLSEEEVRELQKEKVLY